MDLVKNFEGHNHLMTDMDRTTRWPEVIPLHSSMAQAVADAFVANWVACQIIPELPEMGVRS